MSILKKMLQLNQGYRVPGGIKPAAHKLVSLRSRIMPIPVPPQLVLPLTQQQGAAATPLVKVGDRVLKYQAIAKAEGPHSVALHAPTSGVITAIADATLADDSGARGLCIHLQSDGNDTAAELQPVTDYRSLSHLQLLKLVEDAGICGLGGAGFPSAEKLRLSIDRGVGLLIINAAECEPYITADEALLRERAAQVVEGAEILQAICLAQDCIIAIEDDKLEAIASLQQALTMSSVQLLTVTSKYPAGGEKQLIQAVTGKEVPTGGYPADIGILMHNVGTAYAVYQAIVLGSPCISRITTLTGSPLQTPKNFETLIGTPVSFLLKLCGVNEATHTMTIMGGSLMGKVLADVDAPVSKISNCLIAASSEEFPALESEQACIRCGYCASACPASLLPQQLYAYSRSEDWQQLQDYGLFDCIECGACAYVCPSHIPLLQYYRASKANIREHLTQQTRSEHWQQRFQTHQYRIKKEKDQATDLNKKDRKIRKPDDSISQSVDSAFSRERAREEISAAVARVKARRANVIASSDSDSGKGA